MDLMLFDGDGSGLDVRKGRSRRSDPDTSAAGGDSVAYRAGSQKARLLREYAVSLDLTDEEAAGAAGLSMRSCWWKRCSELRQDGMIEPVPGAKRLGTAGDYQMVCRITDAGRAAMGRANEHKVD